MAVKTIANDLDIMSQAITDVILELFIKNQIHFDILTYGNVTRRSLDIINMIEVKNGGNFAEKIQKIQPDLWDHKIYKSAVIFTENVETLNQLTKKSSLDSPFPHRISFVMICENYFADKLSILAPAYLDDTIGRIPIYQYYLTNEITSVDLYTFEWFTEENCNKKQLMKLNFFNKKSMKWNKELAIDEKYKNFHGCMLTVRLGVKYMMTNVDPLTFQPFGPIVDLFKAMAHVGNFTYNYQLFLKTDSIEDLPKDGMIMEYNAHFQLAVFMHSAVEETLHFMTLFKEETVVCLLTPGEPYDSYEKLLFPFDFWTWMILLAVFVCSFLSIIFINQLPTRFQNIVYGENVMSPALNVGVISFGISQTQLPFKNFPRIILVTFIIFCLVMRTAYQGVFFEMIAADITKPLPKTFHDLYLKNYSIQVIYFVELQFRRLLPKEEM